MLFSSKSTRCVRNSVCVSVRQRVSKPIAEHSMGVIFMYQISYPFETCALSTVIIRCQKLPRDEFPAEIWQIMGTGFSRLWTHSQNFISSSWVMSARAQSLTCKSTLCQHYITLEPKVDECSFEVQST